ncbi:putative rna polymerase i and iii shared subunit rpc19 [Moniliophthora roreri]|nr:putative rna polymerase i and iii shared subunit rpc19 [Moniliophthora roreri]
MAESSIPKIRIMKGATPDLSAATYQIHDESHTIGNALRWMLMKNPKVEFCGYRYFCCFQHKKIIPFVLIEERTITDENNSFYIFLFLMASHSPEVSSQNVVPRVAASSSTLLFFTCVPHPSEPNIQVRIQMYDGLSSLDALIKALSDLDDLCEVVSDKYNDSLQHDDYERWEEKS